MTAFLAIVSVISGDFGTFQLKVLATTFSISAASICAMSSTAFAKRHHKPGAIGIGLAALAAACVILGVWVEIDSESYWKFSLSLAILAVALAHGFLVLMPYLSAKTQWVQKAALVYIGLLSLQLLTAMWLEIDDDAFYKFLAVVSILVVLLTLFVPIVRLIDKPTIEQAISGINHNTAGSLVPNSQSNILPENDVTGQLVLRRQADGTFVDQHGQGYHVTPIATDADQAGSVDINSAQTQAQAQTD